MEFWMSLAEKLSLTPALHIPDSSMRQAQPTLNLKIAYLPEEDGTLQEPTISEQTLLTTLLSTVACSRTSI